MLQEPMDDILPKLLAVIILAPLVIGAFAAWAWWQRIPGAFDYAFNFFDRLFQRLSKNKDQ
jgi:hypothetical protein